MSNCLHRQPPCETISTQTFRYSVLFISTVFLLNWRLISTPKGGHVANEVGITDKFFKITIVAAGG